MRKIWIIMAGIIVLLAIAILFSPIFIKNYFNEHSKELTGRKSSIETLSLNPFNASISITDFKFYEADDTAIFVSLDSIYVNISFLKLIATSIELEEIRLINPKIQIIQEGDFFNFDDLIRSDDTASTKDSRENTEFVLKEIHLVDGNIKYYDKQIDHQIDFDRLNFYLPIIAWNSKSANMGIELQINKTGRLRITNNYFPETNAFESQIGLTNLEIDFLYPYLKPYLKIAGISGNFNCDLEIKGQFSETNSLNISGNSYLNNLIISDTASIPLLSADSLNISISSVDVFNEKYLLKKIFIEKPFLRFDLTDSTNSIYEIIVEKQMLADSLDKADTVINPSNLYYTVDTLILVNGIFKYRDYSLDENYEYNITNLVSQTYNLVSDAELLNISAGGIINNHGIFNTVLSIEPENMMNFSVEFEIEDFQMTDFSPLSIYYAGYPVFEGILVYSGKTTIKDMELTSKNKITIYDFALGKKIEKKPLYAIPLKFAIFLLKDKNGVVNLDLPIEGNIEDPKFKIGRLIWQIIKQNAEKVVAAPGNALARQYGFDEREIRFVAFDVNESSLNISSTETLDKLILIVKEKNGLEIGLKYHDNAIRDSGAIALAESKKNYVIEMLDIMDVEKAEIIAQNIPTSDKFFTEYLITNANVESGNPDTLALSYISEETIMTIFETLKRERDSAVISYIRASNDSASGQFKFIGDNEMSKYLIEKPGYEVKFNMHDSE